MLLLLLGLGNGAAEESIPMLTTNHVSAGESPAISSRKASNASQSSHRRKPSNPVAPRHVEIAQRESSPTVKVTDINRDPLPFGWYIHTSGAQP